MNDHCSQGACAGSVVTCNDNNPCTKDSCDETHDQCVNDPIAGCLNCAVDTDCNDGNDCTRDQCLNSKCEFTPLTGTSCEDGNQCTAGDTCKDGFCQSGFPVVCMVKVCHTVTCDPAKGCVYTPQTGGTCDDGDACTGPDQCVGGWCVPGPLLCCEGKPDGTACSDQDDSTGPDFCIGGQCRGFYAVPFRAGDQTGLTAADAAAGPVGVGWYQNANEESPTGFVVDLTFGKTPTVISSTKAAGKRYRSVSSWLAVGDDGLVAYRTSWSTDWTDWVVGGVLGDVLASMDPVPGDLEDVFGVLGPEPTGFCLCCRGDSYLMVGRDANGAQAWARQCTLYQRFTVWGFCTTEAKCGGFTLDGLDPTESWPVAVAGLPAEACPGPCLDQAAIMSRVQLAFSSSRPAVSIGNNAGEFIETFRPLDAVGFFLNPVRDAVGLHDPNLGDVYLAVGDMGSLLVANLATSEVTPVEGMADQEAYDFTGVAMGGGYVFLSAVRTEKDGSRSLVLVVHPVKQTVLDPSTYVAMTLGTCNPVNNGCEGYSLDDVTVTPDGTQVTLVGNSRVDNDPSGLVFFLRL